MLKRDDGAVHVMSFRGSYIIGGSYNRCDEKKFLQRNIRSEEVLEDSSNG